MALTVVDAGVIIGVLDADDPHHSSAATAIAEALSRNQEIVLPASAYAESLVRPLQTSTHATAVVDAFLDELPARIQPVDIPIARAAALLRATHGGSLALPDALVVATAQTLRAADLLTTDAGWPAVDAPLTVLRP